jgi:glutathione S-transferase
MDVTLYGMGISHPARAARLMLAHKGIEAREIDLPPGSQQVAMRAFGFRGGTVPGLKVDGRRVQGSRAIARELDEIKAEPRLFPADPEHRAAVEEAERWGDEVYQPVPRRIFRWSATTNHGVREEMLGRVGIPVPALTSHLLWPVARFYMGLEGGGEVAARGDVAALPEHLDHVDQLISSGLLDGEELNAADFQIAPTTRVLLNFAELRSLIAGRRAEAHAMRVAPRFGWEATIGVPAEWVPSRQ